MRKMGPLQKFSPTPVNPESGTVLRGIFQYHFRHKFMEGWKNFSSLWSISSIFKPLTPEEKI